MLFWRVKPLDKILETAGRKALTRQLGAFQLTMLGIGAVIYRFRRESPMPA